MKLPPALVPDRLDRGRGGLGVEVLAAPLEGPKVRVQLVHGRDAGRDVQADDVLVGDLVEVLDQRPQRVAVGRDEHHAARSQVGHDPVVPVRQHARHHVLQALAARPQLGREAGVAGIAGLALQRLALQRRRRGVVRAAPEHELLLAVPLERLPLVLPLQRTVVALVQPPRPPDRDPVPAADVERDVRGADGAAQDGRVQDVGQQPAVAQQLARSLRLGLAGRGEADVHPAGEQVQGVPLALAVAEQQQPRHLSGASTLATAPIIVENSSTLRLAPPTRQPSQLSSSTYDVTLAALTLPPYSTRTRPAASAPNASSNRRRITSIVAPAWAGSALRPVPIAQTGSYAMTSRSTTSAVSGCSAAESCRRHTVSVWPESSSSSRSPMQTITLRPNSSAATALWATCWSVSPKRARRSEWPVITQPHQPASMAADTSPVYAPDRSQ